MGLVIDPSCKSPCALVAEGFETSMKYADDAFITSVKFLDSLYNSIDPQLATDIPFAQAIYPTVGDNITPFKVDPPAKAPEVNLNIGDAPQLGGLINVRPIQVDEPPEFIANYPDINLPMAPPPLDATPPGQAPSVVQPVLPDAPEYTIPDVPDLREIELPDVPQIDLIEFDATPPDDSGLTPPSQTIQWNELMYQSELLDEVNSKLLYDIQNGTAGLPEVIEQQFYDRAANRETEAGRKAKQQAADEFAARGFSLPPGALSRRMQEINQDVANKQSTLSREVYINQAERALQQLQFALTTALQSEGLLMNYSNSVAQRAFDAQRAIMDASIAIFNANVAAYNAGVQAYATYAQVFRTRIEAETLKLEQYNAQLQGQKLIGDINLQDIQAYTASINAIQTIVDTYKTEVQAKMAEVDVQRLVLEGYRTEVEAFRSRVDAKNSEYQSYTAQINGELSKVQLYSAEVNAYQSRINGYSALTSAKAAQTSSDISVNQGKLAEFSGKLDAYRANITAETEKLRAQMSQYAAEIQQYQATVTGEQARLGADVNISQLQYQQQTNLAEIQIKEAEVNINRAINSLTLMNQSLQQGSSTSSSLASAALSAVNLGAEVSGRDSTTVTLSGSA